MKTKKELNGVVKTFRSGNILGRSKDFYYFFQRSLILGLTVLLPLGICGILGTAEAAPTPEKMNPYVEIDAAQAYKSRLNEYYRNLIFIPKEGDRGYLIYFLLAWVILFLPS